MMILCDRNRLMQVRREEQTLLFHDVRNMPHILLRVEERTVSTTPPYSSC